MKRAKSRLRRRTPPSRRTAEPSGARGSGGPPEPPRFHRLRNVWYDYYFLRGVAALYARLGRHGFFLVWATLTGLATGAAAILIRLTAAMLGDAAALAADRFPPALAVLPVIGIALAVGVKRLLGDSGNSSSDMTLLIRAVRSRRPGLIRLETFSHILASPFTVGFGGAVGLATPSVLAGASLGARLGGLLKVTPGRRVTLMACGAAAGISAVFDSPVSGVLFAVEILLPRTTASGLLPVLFAAAGASVLAQLGFGPGAFFRMESRPPELRALPGYLLLGVLSAAVGRYMIRCSYWIEDWFAAGRFGRRTRLAVGGTAAAVLIALLPVLAGEGTEPLRRLLAGGLPTAPALRLPGLPPLPAEAVPLLLAGAAVLLKIVAGSLTLNAGGAGGFFGPTLFTGAFTGLLFARLANRWTGAGLFEPDFIAAGMCGVFAAAFRAPLTGIFLVCEMGGSYQLMLPLILVAALSGLLASRAEAGSIYTRLNAEPGADPGDPRHRRLGRMRVGRLLAPGAPAVIVAGAPPEREGFLAVHPEPRFAVVDAAGRLLGLLPRTAAARPDGAIDPSAHLESPTGVLNRDDSLLRAAAAFRLFAVEELPVVDRTHRFVGFLGRRTLEAAVEAVEAADRKNSDSRAFPGKKRPTA